MRTYLLTGFIALAIPTACLSGCTTDYETMGTVMTPGMNLEPEIEEPTGTIERNKSFIYACNFDDTDVTVKSVNCQLEVADDPVREGKCGKVTMNKCGTSDCVQIILDHPLDFTLNDAKITFELYGQKKGAKIVCKLSSSFGEKQYALSPDRFERTTLKSGEWEKFEFDWSAQKPQSNLYNTITIVINQGKDNKTMGEVWYVDNISVPNSDLSSISLFKRVTNHQAPKPNRSGNADYEWMCNSTANPQILTPEESDGKNWWLYMRGADGTYGQIGAYTQPKDKFNPIGSWTEVNGGQPVIKRNFHKNQDEFTAIDPAAVKKPGGNTLYMFYKGLSMTTDPKTGKKVPSILVAKSEDGVKFQSVAKVFKENAGVADAVYHDGKYYLFVSRRMYETTDPESGDAVETQNIIPLGEVYGKDNVALNFDRYSINGQKVTRIGDYWFMFYQCSPCHDDFPDRIHVAYSSDLKKWKKVKNDIPLFTRGKRHSWDEGAIWAPEVFEYDDDLYMYYEGWGRGTDDRAQGDTIPNRDKKYFKGGHSEIGVAKCSKKAFLEWCGTLE